MIRAVIEGLDKFLRDMTRVTVEARKAVTAGINRSANEARVVASRAIRAQIALPAKYVNERFKIRYARGDEMSAELSTPKRGMLLSRFATRPALPKVSGSKLPRPKSGIAVKVKPNGGFKLIAKAFFLKLKYPTKEGNDNIGIAVRPRGGKVKVLHGPSMSQVFNSVREDIAPEIARRAKKNVDYLLDRALEPFK